MARLRKACSKVDDVLQCVDASCGVLALRLLQMWGNLLEDIEYAQQLVSSLFWTGLHDYLSPWQM